MHIEYIYKFEDFADACAAQKSPSRAVRRWIVRLVVWSLVLAVSLGIGLYYAFFAEEPLTAAEAQSNSQHVHIIWPLALISAVVVVLNLPPVVKLEQRRLARKLWDTTPTLHDRYALDVTDQVLSLTTAESQTHLKWPAFRKFIDAPAVLLLFTTPTEYVFFPKRIFSPDQLNTFTQLCRQNIHEPLPGAFPVLPAQKTPPSS